VIETFCRPDRQTKNRVAYFAAGPLKGPGASERGRGRKGCEAGDLAHLLKELASWNAGQARLRRCVVVAGSIWNSPFRGKKFSLIHDESLITRGALSRDRRGSGRCGVGSNNGAGTGASGKGSSVGVGVVALGPRKEQGNPVFILAVRHKIVSTDSAVSTI
jgi:hypothetical protein